MAQDDGTLEAYCAKNNHKRVLVNVPELAGEVYEAIESEIAAAVAGGHGAAKESEPRSEEISSSAKADDAAIQHGASSESHSPSD